MSERGMVNFTLTMPDEDRKELRQFALDNNTTVSALVRKWFKEEKRKGSGLMRGVNFDTLYLLSFVEKFSKQMKEHEPVPLSKATDDMVDKYIIYDDSFAVWRWDEQEAYAIVRSFPGFDLSSLKNMSFEEKRKPVNKIPCYEVYDLTLDRFLNEDLRGDFNIILRKFRSTMWVEIKGFPAKEEWLPPAVVIHSDGSWTQDSVMPYLDYAYDGVFYNGESEEEFKKLIGADTIENSSKEFAFGVDTDGFCICVDEGCTPDWMKTNSGYYYGFKVINTAIEESDRSVDEISKHLLTKRKVFDLAARTKSMTKLKKMIEAEGIYCEYYPLATTDELLILTGISDYDGFGLAVKKSDTGGFVVDDMLEQ